MVQFGDGRDWFFEKRFGLFVHWGLYALGAWHEQEQFRRHLPRQEYARQIHEFNPVRFDPEAWLDLAESVGMQYITFTTKHQDGFCLWDTQETDYKVTNTPFGKDVLAILAKACHRRNFPLCLYYCLVDNHHPNYPNAGRGHELSAPDPGDQPDVAQYVAYVKAQAHELCTRYGKIHGFWWDVNDMGHHDSSINEMIRSLQPGIIINNRGYSEGDFSTPERDWDNAVEESLAFPSPTEACQSVGIESWGYRENEDYYSDIHLIRSIDKVLAKGGNYLLNVGPKADGTFPEEGIRILRKIGDWYHSVKESFEGTIPASELTDNREVLITRKDKTLYVHLHKAPVGTAVVLLPIADLPRKAILLNTGEEVEACVDLLPTYYTHEAPCLRLRNLPVNRMPDTALVVKLEFEDEEVFA